jgi:hypothetical protein
MAVLTFMGIRVSLAAWQGMFYTRAPFSLLARTAAPLALLIVNYANVSAPFIHRRILVGASAGEGATVGTPNRSVSSLGSFICASALQSV